MAGLEELAVIVDEAQRAAAEKSRDALAASGRFDRAIATEIVALERFWPAEDYPQDYYEKEPLHYKMYRAGSGRDAFLKKVWGDDLEPARRPRAYTKPPADVLRERLTELQWHVTQEDGTEREGPRDPATDEGSTVAEVGDVPRRGRREGSVVQAEGEQDDRDRDVEAQEQASPVRFVERASGDEEQPGRGEEERDPQQDKER